MAARDAGSVPRRHAASPLAIACCLLACATAVPSRAGEAPPAVRDQLVALDPVARDVFMGGDHEKNLYVFERDAAGKVVELVERRKFNHLHLRREPAP